MGIWQLMLNILWKMLNFSCGHAKQPNPTTLSPCRVTKLICRVVTPKDKERDPSPLTGQKFFRNFALCLRLYVELAHLKTKKDMQAPIQNKTSAQSTDCVTCLTPKMSRSSLNSLSVWPQLLSRASLLLFVSTHTFLVARPAHNSLIT